MTAKLLTLFLSLSCLAACAQDRASVPACPVDAPNPKAGMIYEGGHADIYAPKCYGKIQDGRCVNAPMF